MLGEKRLVLWEYNQSKQSRKCSAERKDVERRKRRWNPGYTSTSTHMRRAEALYSCRDRDSWLAFLGVAVACSTVASAYSTVKYSVNRYSTAPRLHKLQCIDYPIPPVQPLSINIQFSRPVIKPRYPSASSCWTRAAASSDTAAHSHCRAPAVPCPRRAPQPPPFSPPRHPASCPAGSDTCSPP